MANYKEELKARIIEEKAAIELIKITSDLSFERSIELTIFRNQLIDKRSSEILNLHEYAKAFVEKPINIKETLAIAKAIASFKIITFAILKCRVFNYNSSSIISSDVS